MISAVAHQDDRALIRRANRLYHECTRDSFERSHRRRFGVQRSFWHAVARAGLGARDREEAGSSAGDRPRTILDVACGSGFVSRALAEYLRPHDRLLAVDLGEGQLRTTREHWAALRASRAHAPAFLSLATDAQSLPLPDASVDLAAMNAALHHMPDPPKVLAEIDRVLRPGGFFALGFEPNRAYFASPALVLVGRTLDRLHWYANPRRNWRRLRAKLAPAGRRERTGDEGLLVLSAINDTLLREQLITEPLAAGQLLDLVDPHSRGDTTSIGFDPRELIAGSLAGYAVDILLTTDYLGETGRFWPTARFVIDAAMRTFLPGHGSLFSWLVRKPEAGK